MVDDLLAGGYENVTVLDISQTNINMAKVRLGAASESVRWLRADLTLADFPPRSYDVWHDRAVFHFLTRPAQRRAYVRKCSGLDVVRYDAQSLHAEFGPSFRLVENGTAQQFFYCHFILNPALRMSPHED